MSNAPPVPPSVSHSASPPGGDVVLVVDDEEDIRRLVTFNLGDAGFKVESVENGADALVAAARLRPSVVVLDLMLPDLSGMEVCRRLRADETVADAAILMLTARGDEYDRVLGFEVGADDYVVKPFSVRELVMRVKGLARRANERRLARGARDEGQRLAWRGLARDVEDIVSPNRDTRRFQILEISNVRARKHLYLPIKLLVFSDGQAVVPEIMILVEGEESPYHLNQLALSGGIAGLGLRVDPVSADPTARSQIERDLEQTIERGEAAGGESPEITQIGVFDHPIQLQQALAGAKKRILIIAPWVRGAVVDTSFLAELERRLRSGVHVLIGHGYGRDDSGSDEQALRRLKNLEARFPDRFSIVRLPNTHAKILIYDDTYITTSFNWLSFRGDKDRTYRMEEGTMVRGAEYADKVFDRYSDELKLSRLHGADPGTDRGR